MGQVAGESISGDDLGVIELPDADGVPVLRIDFSDDTAWENLKSALLTPDRDSGYEASLVFIDRPDLAGRTAEDIEQEIPRTFPVAYGQPCVILADSIAMSSPERSVYLIDLDADDASTSFRATPNWIAAIEANLSLANLDFADFGSNADPDGVFRGFR